MRPTKAIIHLDNLQHNIREVKKRLNENVKICLAVKADAYGHGAVHSSVAAIRSGVTHLAVASVQEGIELRNAGIIAPIISLSIPSLDEAKDIVLNNIQPLVVDEEYIEQLNNVAFSLNKKAGVHLKVDTGMARIGCKGDEVTRLAKKINEKGNLHLEGVATHFAVSDSKNTDDISFTEKQISIFKKAIANIQNEGIRIPLIHASNSGAVLFQKEQFDMVRIGLLAYGYSPFDEEICEIDLKPVMELLTEVVFIKKVEKGESVSYGRTWVCPKDTYIATLPIGYADGLSRSLSSKLKVRIGSSFYPIVGRICMDQCMVDIGAEPSVKRWDEVCVFGPSNGIKNNSAKDVANYAGTICYEITSNINKRVPRVYLG
ncbi:MAG: alanine racemase [Treponema sp.]